VGWLAKLLGATPRQELQGIELDTTRSFWRLEGKTDFPRLLRALTALLPEGCVLYFEGGSPAKPLVDFFQAHEIPEQSDVAVGILWPRPIYYHVPATPENLSEMAELAEYHAAPEFAVHFHVYRNAEVLLQWHDAFGQPMLLSRALPEHKVRAFAETLNMTVNYQTS
jgi:hypothetical protein